MIFYKVRHMVKNGTVREFDDAESAIRAAMSYDHEHEVLMCDSQGYGREVRFAYIWLNKIHIDDMSSSDFFAAAKRVASIWPYKIAV